MQRKINKIYRTNTNPDLKCKKCTKTKTTAAFSESHTCANVEADSPAKGS